MRKTERLHAIARQLAICKNCYSINHHSLFKVRNAECLNHQRGLIVTAGLVRQLFLDTQQTFVCCWCYYITYDCMCQHLFLKLFAISILTAQQVGLCESRLFISRVIRCTFLLSPEYRPGSTPLISSFTIHKGLQLLQVCYFLVWYVTSR